MALHAQARRLARSGQSELGVLASQCLDRRIADEQILAREVAAWQDHRNKRHAKADWQFTTANARVKLKRLYPEFSDSGDRLPWKLEVRSNHPRTSFDLTYDGTQCIVRNVGSRWEIEAH